MGPWFKGLATTDNGEDIQQDRWEDLSAGDGKANSWAMGNVGLDILEGLASSDTGEILAA
jgi:hypothetical protein